MMTIGFGALFIALMAGYFLLNPSYEKSLKAKYYYNTGDYKYALTLAQEAFNMDLYNRMAATIMTQSKASLKFVDYNDDAKKYMNEINEIAKKEYIEYADKAKMRLMSEVMIASYKKLAPSTVIDSNLKKEAQKNYNEFEKLLEKVTR